MTEDYTYDTSKMVAFHLPAGTAVECFATTLHYAPCNYQGNKFRVVVVLPKGTNTDLDFKADSTPEDKLLFARNKEQVAHRTSGSEDRGSV